MFGAALLTTAKRQIQPKWPSTHKQINKTVAFPYSGLLVSSEKKWGPDTYHDVAESQKHCAKQKKADKKVT